jgi:hypothetical protein
VGAARSRPSSAAAVGEKSRLEGRGEADRTLAIGGATAQSTKLAVDAYGGPEYRLAEQNFARFADALTKINQPIVPQFLMSGGAAQEGGSGGLIPMAMLSSMFGRLMPDALEKLKERRRGRHRRSRATGRVDGAVANDTAVVGVPGRVLINPA